MSSPNSVNPVSNSSGNSPIVTDANTQIVGANSTSKHNSSTMSSNTSIGNNLASLKEKAPKVYDAMMQGIAMNICQKMKRDQDKIKEINRKARTS